MDHVRRIKEEHLPPNNYFSESPLCTLGLVKELRKYIKAWSNNRFNIGVAQNLVVFTHTALLQFFIFI